MIHSFVIDATGDDRRRIRNGMEALAALADAHAIPMTWAVDSRVARSASGDWMNAREGDGHLLALHTADWIEPAQDDEDIQAAAERQVRERERFPRLIEQERNRVVEAIPSAKLTVAGAEMKNAALIDALDATEFQGLWGYRWNEASARCLDRGCPFGFFYAGRDRHQSAGPPISGIVGVSRETVDLAFRRRIPPEPREIQSEPFDLASHEEKTGRRFAPDPFDVASCLRAAERVAHCRGFNEWNAVVQTLNAAACADLTDAQRDELVEGWRRLKELGFESVPLSDAVADYRERFPETEPAATVIETVETSEGDQSTQRTRLDMMYADARGMFIFDQHVSEPAELFNYASPSASSQFLTEYEMPELASFEPIRTREKLSLSFKIDSPKPMPYALFLWGDHRHLNIVEENVLDVRWLGNEGMLLLIDLETGTNEFSVLLTI